MDIEKAFRFFTIPLILGVDSVSMGFAIYLIKISLSAFSIFVSIMFLITTIVADFFNTIAAFEYYGSYEYEKKFNNSKKWKRELRRFPTVALVVPSYNEDPRVVKKTLQKLQEVNYPKDKYRIYLLDDSMESISGQLKRFCKENGIVFLHRKERKDFKAGALNNFLKHSNNEEFIAIFDADEYLINKNFLLDLLPLFDDNKVAYVQTAKRYANGGLFENSINLFNSFFFSFVQPSRAKRNTSIYAGSCGILRRSIIEKLGGFPKEVLEDTFFSFKSRINNYKGIYVPKVYALGRPLKTFTAFAKQQWRYNYGGTKFLKNYISSIFKVKFSVREHIDYISLGFGLNYLSAILVIFTLLSILIIFANYPFSSISPSFFFNPYYIKNYLEIYGMIALLLSFIAPVFVSRIYFGSFTYGIMTFLLNFALAIIRTEAAIAALFNKSPIKGWVKTLSKSNKGRAVMALKNSYAEIAFSSSLFVFSVFALLQNNFSGFLWLIWYAALYSSTFFFFFKYG
ncbi:MAG: glycosyltransferase [Candidatus Micrarchaeaceae archaeon]